MKPVVLLVGKLPGIVGRMEAALGELGVEWLGATTRDEVVRQLDAEPAIRTVVLGGTLDDTLRGELIGAIASRRPDLAIHVKDRESGPEGMPDFVRRVVQGFVIH
jgi:hypothetical protein